MGISACDTPNMNGSQTDYVSELFHIVCMEIAYLVAVLINATWVVK